MAISSDRPNLTIFLPNYSLANRTMFVQNGRTGSANAANFCRRFGSVSFLPKVFGVRLITTVDNYERTIVNVEVFFPQQTVT